MDMINFTLTGDPAFTVNYGRQRPPAGGARGGPGRDGVRASAAARVGCR